MGQGLAFVAIQKNDLAGFGLLLAMSGAANPVDLGGDLASLQCVPRSPPTELFLRSALDNCERLMRTPSRASISARNRGCGQPEGDHAQRRLTLHRSRAGRERGPQRLDAAAHEVTPPQANRVLAHTKGLGNPWAGPARQRQQHGTRAVRLAAIARAGQHRQGGALGLGCRERRSSCHALHPIISHSTEPARQALVNQPEAA
jgi:hypothetical protein